MLDVVLRLIFEGRGAGEGSGAGSKTCAENFVWGNGAQMTGSAWKCTSCVLDVLFHLYFQGEGSRGGEWFGIFFSTLLLLRKFAKHFGKLMVFQDEGDVGRMNGGEWR